jgi:ABC-type multidrug transport system fused ATPase/permease subunit
MGFIDPIKGDIYINNINMKKISKTQLRSKIGYVGQQAFLFNDSIKKNISYANPKKSLDEIIAVSKAAHVHDFVNKFPLKYNSQVGQNGNKISAGQKQRITIARALLKDPEILIFDEITSALDQKSESIIELTLRNIKGSKTIIIISHKPMLLEHVDQLVMIKNKQLQKVSKKILQSYYYSSKGLS